MNYSPAIESNPKTPPVQPPTGTVLKPVSVQTVENFLAREIPPKEPLVEGLLCRRDIVAFAGRRRHGKTTFSSSLAVAASLPLPEFLGYPIPKAVRVAVFFLEDDSGDIQEKMRLLLDGRNSGERLAVYTREDFQHAGIPIDMAEKKFQERITQICEAHRPDIIIFDNLAHLVGADYSNPKKIHSLMISVFDMTSAFNAAVIIAAHPRKRGAESDAMYGPATVSLRNNSEAFFEGVMGSSHFINSCGSLWGIERDIETNQTEFLGGTQRADGQEMVITLEKGNDGWFRVLDDISINFPIAMKSDQRKKAWNLLPSGDFTYGEGERAVKSAMSSSSTFAGWFKQLRHLKLVRPGAGVKYRKAVIPEAAGQTKQPSPGTGGK